MKFVNELNVEKFLVPDKDYSCFFVLSGGDLIDRGGKNLGNYYAYGLGEHQVIARKWFLEPEVVLGVADTIEDARERIEGILEKKVGDNQTS